MFVKVDFKGLNINDGLLLKLCWLNLYLFRIEAKAWYHCLEGVFGGYDPGIIFVCLEGGEGSRSNSHNL